MRAGIMSKSLSRKSAVVCQVENAFVVSLQWRCSLDTTGKGIIIICAGNAWGSKKSDTHVKSMEGGVFFLPFQNQKHKRKSVKLLLNSVFISSTSG